MTADPRALAELLEESEDLQSDALRPTHDALDELVETAHSSRDDDVTANRAFFEEHQRSLRTSPGRLQTAPHAYRAARSSNSGGNPAEVVPSMAFRMAAPASYSSLLTIRQLLRLDPPGRVEH